MAPIPETEKEYSEDAADTTDASSWERLSTSRGVRGAGGANVFGRFAELSRTHLGLTIGSVNRALYGFSPLGAYLYMASSLLTYHEWHFPSLYL